MIFYAYSKLYDCKTPSFGLEDFLLCIYSIFDNIIIININLI